MSALFNGPGKQRKIRQRNEEFHSNINYTCCNGSLWDYKQQTRFLLEFLIIKHGFVEDLNDLTSYQKEHLGKIKSNFEQLEKKSLTYSRKVFEEWYQEECSTSALVISGLNLPAENSDVWEFYVQSHEQDKYLIVVVIFDGLEIKSHTVID